MFVLYFDINCTDANYVTVVSSFCSTEFFSYLLLMSMIKALKKALETQNVPWSCHHGNMVFQDFVKYRRDSKRRFQLEKYIYSLNLFFSSKLKSINLKNFSLHNRQKAIFFKAEAFKENISMESRSAKKTHI